MFHLVDRRPFELNSIANNCIKSVVAETLRVRVFDISHFHFTTEQLGLRKYIQHPATLSLLVSYGK